MNHRNTTSLTWLAAALFCALFVAVVCGASQAIAQSADSESSVASGAADTSSLSAVPLGLPPVDIPADNPMTPEKVELGKLLYFDPRLSKDGTISCATCHNPKEGWSEQRMTSKGIKDQIGTRNSPTVINSAYHPVQFWDGRAATLEEQALGPIENPIEMGYKLDAVVKDLSAIPGYTSRFKAVFGTEVTKDGIGKAIAAFERTILSGNSPYDRFKAGDATALSDPQKRGLEVFVRKGKCSMCHTPPTFASGRYYNAGVDAAKSEPDPGRMEVTKKDRDFGKFRVPHLRDLVDTGPYFHDGSAKTLEATVGLMADGGRDNPNLSSMMKRIRKAKLTDQDREDLVEFLKALSGDYPIIEPPALP